jgi:hypothetical protein
MQFLTTKIKQLLICLCLVYLFACQPTYEQTATNSECAKFKKGKFVHQSEDDTTIYRIERNDSVQTEFIRNAGEYVHLKIKWTSPCSYELTYLNQHVFGADTVPVSYQNMKINVDILKVNGDTCFVLTNDGISKRTGVFYIDKNAIQ